MSRLLLVSEDPALYQRLQLLLGSAHIVERVADTKAALAAARSSRPALIVLDWKDHEGDLYGLGRLREDPTTAGLPVVVMAAGDAPALLAGGGGAAACFPKPVPFDRLHETLLRLAPPSAGARLLIADDDMEYAELLSAFAKDSGYQPMLALSGKRALELARSEPPAAMLLDLMLPGPDGLEVLRRLRSDSAMAKAPIIVISALQFGTGHSELLVRDASDDALRAALAPKLAVADKPRLLLADDEIDLLELMREALESEGFQVETATDGKEALDRLKASPHDLAVIDVKMPRKTGLELCGDMRRDAALKDVPILLLSADGRHAHAPGLGADDFLPKPVDVALLVRRVRQALARRARRV